MKKIYIIIAVIALLFAACSKESLKLHNPNQPGIESLKTEKGIQKYALGVFAPMKSNYYGWLPLTFHNLMGDATTSRANNFGFRYCNQIFTVTRPNGIVLSSPLGNETQEGILKRLNTRENSDNTFNYEWKAMYGVLGHCNLALKLLDNNEVVFSDNAEVKKKTYQAWFLWWKAFAYSRIGSIYTKGIITNEYNTLNNNYQSHDAVIAEANRIFEQAKTILATIPESDVTYSTLIDAFIPSQFKVGNGGIITPQMFIRNINTYMARNLLVNKYVSELNSADLSQIKTLVDNGIQRGDKIFTIRSLANGGLCFVSEHAWSPYRVLVGWENVSERLIQDFKRGDNRFTRNFELNTRALANPNDRGYGIGTTYNFKDGGDYASTTPGTVELPFAGTYEENQLMLAEVKIRNNDIEGGLAHIDAVRTYQNAQLPAVTGAGLNQVDALEELRKERRIGLFQKGTAFYDARRWGILKPISEGGGRRGANVLVAAGTVEPCIIDYQYIEWFDVPAAETDFNKM